MSQESGFIGYATVMLLAGVGIPIMATLNSGLGVRLQNPALATLVLLLLGSSIATICIVATAKFSNPFQSHIPFYYYLGGALVVFYILSITWAAPRFGVGNAISFVLLGQLVSMALIDHFGLMGAIKNTITLQRLAGISLMAVGAFLAVKRGGAA